MHKNRHVKGFGAYGDVMIRDRKMYVAPTPFGLLSGVAHTQTLILPEGFVSADELQRVGRLVSREAATLVIGYKFDLRTNDLLLDAIPNPAAGTEHVFEAWRLGARPGPVPTIREASAPYDTVFLRVNPTLAPGWDEDA
jgi:hypothetical protein